jgi:hypothetical protein
MKMSSVQSMNWLAHFAPKEPIQIKYEMGRWMLWVGPKLYHSQISLADAFANAENDFPLTEVER